MLLTPSYFPKQHQLTGVCCGYRLSALWDRKCRFLQGDREILVLLSEVKYIL